MIPEIPAALKSQYVYCLGVLFILLFLLLVIRSAMRRPRKGWSPLISLVRGKVKKRRKESTMTGSYHGHAVTARLSNGADTPPEFVVQMPLGSGGRDWQISRRSEKLLGPETWRVSTKDPALQARLEAANVVVWLRNWPSQTAVSYDAAQGILTVKEDGPLPSAEHFSAQLELLEALAEMNRKVNGD